MGNVVEGRNANLVLLDADPLAGVQNLKAIHGVVRGGKYYSASALDDLKKRTEQRHATAA
jgi:imidazolonepropionase-like amidohydrolase